VIQKPKRTIKHLNEQNKNKKKLPDQAKKKIKHGQ